MLAFDQLLPSSSKNMQHLQTMSSLLKLHWQTNTSDKQTLRGVGWHVVFFFSPQNHSCDFFIISLLKVCCCILDQCEIVSVTLH